MIEVFLVTRALDSTILKIQQGNPEASQASRRFARSSRPITPLVPLVDAAFVKLTVHSTKIDMAMFA